MELLFTSDMHGSVAQFNQTLELLRQQCPDVLILGGDCLPDGDRGYPYSSVTKFIRNEFKEFLQRIREISSDIPVLCIFGNHDWTFSINEFAHLQEQALLQILNHRSTIKIDGHRFLGLSHCPPAPYWIKDFERRDLDKDPPAEFGGYTWSDQLRKIISVTGRSYFSNHESLEEMLAQTPNIEEPLVFVSHAPPIQSHLDYILDGSHVGSHAVRQYLEKTQPLLSLHGHFHDSPVVSGHFTDMIGKCLAVNPGQDPDRLCAVRWSSDQPTQLHHSLDWPP